MAFSRSDFLLFFLEDDQNLLPEVTSSSYFPNTEIALNTISKCIDELLRMQSMFFALSQFGRSPSPDLSDEEDNVIDEITDIKSSVVRLIEKLFMDPKEGDYFPPSCSDFCFPATGTAFTFIYECIQELVQMQCCVHQMAISLSQGESVEKEQQEVLRIKSSVVLRINTLFKKSQDWKIESCDESTTYVESYESFEIDDTDECASPVFAPPVPVKEFIKEEFKWSSVKESETEEKERYLCLSNGYEIWCLDLKRSRSNQPDLPIITTLSLLGEQLPASVGLFKSGSDAYLIGGQELPPPSGFRDDGSWGEVPVALSHYKSYCYLQGIKGSSPLTYRLSLTADKADGSLSLSPKACSDFVQELNKPKIWPIVEKIDEKLHVMDSVPDFLLGNREWIFTHEVHDLRANRQEDGGWKNIPTIEKTEHIISHVVVGHRVYALTSEMQEESNFSESGLDVVREGCRFLEFDAREEKWEGCTVWRTFGPYEVKRIHDILCLGTARCALEFRNPQEGGEPLYVLVALSTALSTCLPPDEAVAYLVTSTGKTVCYQRLSDFFKGQTLKPHDIYACTVIHVEDEEEEKGRARTMCSVFTGTLAEEGCSREYLFLNTFSVEKLETEAVSSGIGEILLQKASEVEIGPVVELEFVRFAPKNWYIYETDTDARFRHLGRFVGWQACFLTPP